MVAGDALRRILGLLTGRPTNFGWVIEGELAGSGRPMSEKEVAWLRQQGIDCIISLTEESLPSEWTERNGLQCLHRPLRNHSAPSLEYLKKVVSEMEELISSGKRVLIHCGAGQGRTGTVLAAYLAKRIGISGRESVRRIRELRPGSVEPNQEESVEEFARSIA